MSIQKLDPRLDQTDIKQTRPIKFKDDAINKCLGTEISKFG